MLNSDKEGALATEFLPGERASPESLAAQTALAASSPLVTALLRSWPGAVTVLNELRQVLAVNAGYLETLGVTDPAATLGLRPGETLDCKHAREQPAGCGTTRACASCGLAIAFVAAHDTGAPQERDCVLTTTRGGQTFDFEFRVRASTLELDGFRPVVVTLADVSAERRRASLEKAFLHDISNLVAGLVGACAALDSAEPAEAVAAAADLRRLTERLAREVKLQRALASSQPAPASAAREALLLADVVAHQRLLFQHHPSATGKRLDAPAFVGAQVLETDAFLLNRVLCNLLVNAFEATPPQGEVRLTTQTLGDFAVFTVWNPGVIPAAVAPRIFQRYFTTKDGMGRGQGTFIIKSFTEQSLHGTVAFTSTRDEGTAFTLRLPLK
jgi:signal transduction histidine kinase